MELTIEVTQVGVISVVAAAGELDAHAAPVLEEVVDPLAGVAGGDLVIDLSGVGFIDSTGLGVLVSTLKHVREAGGRLEVVATTPRVLRVLALTGLDAVIPLHDSLDAALVRPS